MTGTWDQNQAAARAVPVHPARLGADLPVQLSPHVRGGHRLQELQSAARHLGQQVGGAGQLRAARRLAVLLAHLPQHPDHQPDAPADRVPCPGRAGAAAQRGPHRRPQAVGADHHLPTHFLSWVVAGGFVVEVLSPNSGIITLVSQWLTGEKSDLFLMISPQWFRWILVFLLTMFFEGGLVPTFIIVRNLGLYNTLWALVLIEAAKVFYMILAMSFFRQIPEAVEESALIDGAGYEVVFLRIVVPMSKALIATLIIFSTVDLWNQFREAVIYIRDVEALHPAGLRTHQGVPGGNDPARSQPVGGDVRRRVRVGDAEGHHPGGDQHPHRAGVPLLPALLHQGRHPRRRPVVNAFTSAAGRSAHRACRRRTPAAGSRALPERQECGPTDRHDPNRGAQHGSDAGRSGRARRSRTRWQLRGGAAPPRAPCRGVP